MGTAKPVQLDAMLEGPQESIRRCQGGCIVTSDIAPRGEGLEGNERGRAAQHDVASTVDELEELDRELNIAQATRAELQLPIPEARRDVLLDPSAHRLHVLDEPRMVGSAPDEGCNGIDVAGSELAVASRWPRLEQRLELPRLRPALVVADMRLDGPDEGSLLALGPKRGIDLPDRALGRHCGAGAHEPGGERCRGAQGFILAGRLTIGDLLCHEDDVDIAHVVELAPPALAHADDRKAAGNRIGGQSRPSHRQGRLEYGVGEVREPCRNNVHRCEPCEVAGRDAEQMGTVRDAQAIKQRGQLTCCHRLVARRIGADGAQQRGTGLSR